MPNAAEVVPVEGVAPAPLGARTRLEARPDLPLIAGVIAVLAWGVGPLFVTAISLSPPSLVMYRLWLGAAITIVMAIVTGGRIDLAAIRATAVPGALFGISMIFGFWSFKTTSVANASIIGALTPTFVLVAAARLFSERCTRQQLLGAFIGFTGVPVVVMAAARSSGQRIPAGPVSVTRSEGLDIEHARRIGTPAAGTTIDFGICTPAGE